MRRNELEKAAAERTKTLLWLERQKDRARQEMDKRQALIAPPPHSPMQWRWYVLIGAFVFALVMAMLWNRLAWGQEAQPKWRVYFWAETSPVKTCDICGKGPAYHLEAQMWQVDSSTITNFRLRSCLDCAIARINSLTKED